MGLFDLTLSTVLQLLQESMYANHSTDRIFLSCCWPLVEVPPSGLLNSAILLSFFPPSSKAEKEKM